MVKVVPGLKTAFWPLAEQPWAAGKEWESQAGIPPQGMETTAELCEGSCWVRVMARQDERPESKKKDSNQG